jgi:hypothetical protein
MNSAPHKLSDDLAVKQTHVGMMLYCPIDEELAQRVPGTSHLVLTDEEAIKFVSWWYEQRYAEADAENDLVTLVVGLVADRQIKPETAVTCIRALMAQAANDALNGWVMPEQD